MTALVVGVGLTGRSLASHLLELGEEVLAIDSRQSPPMAEKMPPVEIWRGEDFRLWPASRFKQFTRVALSAGGVARRCRRPVGNHYRRCGTFYRGVADA